MNSNVLLFSLFAFFVVTVPALPQDVTSTNEPTTIDNHEHTATSTPSTAIPTVKTDGFTDENMNAKPSNQSWLQQNDRYIFIIVLVLLIVAILIYYIVKSIKGMRRRLANENHSQMIMMQNKNNDATTATPPAGANAVNSPYYQQQPSIVPYSPSPLTETVSIADVNNTNGAYKIPDNYQYYQQQQQQQQPPPSPSSPPPSYHTHRY
ncbi:hypothetical protein BDF20DRAFT_837605 [Mycotypha africana]|uniref:uncharacterized protein n=1 Tax=Mycotypha africana TaxID=64632 RepID=UPI002300F9DB|nr:uncharacterized protein BDF20DRAFT_837605 [Mycotypha africana]KAI8973684.1 hypothetical protein BDF20DRAFT_837605 [Mycotypha africana]